jgi:N-acetylglutamate synthase
MPPSALWSAIARGQRVVVRLHIDPAATGFKYTDIKGFVERADATGLLLRLERDGGLRFIPADEIHAAKPIPPRPLPRTNSGGPA